MCGIAGLYSPYGHYLKGKIHYETVLVDTTGQQCHQGPGDSGLYLAEYDGLSHAHLSITDLSGGCQSMMRFGSGQTLVIIYNGELYNVEELHQDLICCGRSLRTSSGTEAIPTGYMEYGPEFVKQLSDIFALAIPDIAKNRLRLFRDRSGVEPLFYMVQDQKIIFVPGLKGTFAYPGIRPRPDKKGLNGIFSIGPARTYGHGVFKNMEELLPRHFPICSHSGLRLESHWKLESHPYEGSYEETVEKTSFLVQDAVRRRVVSDVPICTFLSGDVDSSLVSAICATQLRKQGKGSTTFSFDFMDNDKHLKANFFRPSQDRPFVDHMVQFLDSDRHYLGCGNLTQADRLYDSVLIRDLSAMGDIDSSMLRSCSMVKECNEVALTDECADEIFGGYPWFRKKERSEAYTFPWTMNLNARKVLLGGNFLGYLDMDGYMRDTYERSVAETPILAEDTPVEIRRREVAYLNLRWLTQVLLSRINRASTYPDLEARAPFANHRIIEYVWSVPWDMKTRDGMVKNLLRQLVKGLLPEDILFRCRSPYPETYGTSYERLLAGRVREMMFDNRAPVMQFLDRKKLELFSSNPGNYDKPWHGQLVAGSQMMVYILQISSQMKTYDIELVE